jgi:hypothetical protein
MRLPIIASLAAALALSACGQSPLKTEEKAEAAADAAAVDNAVAAEGAGTGAEGGAAGGADTRGAQGTAAPDATGEPGVTLPTTPPSDGGPVEPTT